MLEVFQTQIKVPDFYDASHHTNGEDIIFQGNRGHSASRPECLDIMLLKSESVCMMLIAIGTSMKIIIMMRGLLFGIKGLSLSAKHMARRNSRRVIFHVIYTYTVQNKYIFGTFITVLLKYAKEFVKLEPSSTL